MDQFRYDVFLSHNSKDKPQVRRLAKRLKQAGLRVWFDEWNIQAGEIISVKIDQGLEQSRVLLLCISPGALASGWVALERSTAIHRDPGNESRRFIPLLLADCDIPDTLRRYKYVDYRTEDEQTFQSLLLVCQPTEATSRVTVEQTPIHERTAPDEKSRVLEHVLTEHSGAITGLAVSSDQNWAVSGSRDKTLIMWDLVTGERLKTLTHTAPLSALALSSDNHLFLSGDDHGSIICWSQQGDVKWRGSTEHASAVTSIAIARNNDLCVSGSKDGTIAVWDINSGTLRTRFQAHPQQVSAVVLLPDNLRIASASADCDVKIWNLETSECMAELRGHRAAVNSFVTSPNGIFGFTSSDDNTILIWDLEAQRCVTKLEGHRGPVGALSISPDGSLLASVGTDDDTLRVWDWEAGKCIFVSQVSFGSSDDLLQLKLRVIALGRDGSRLVAGTNTSLVTTYRILGLKLTKASETMVRYVNAKVVLLGEGTVGKTSLAHRLVEDKYVIRDRTHGMNVWRLDLRLPASATLEREALLWDLAGQEDYRLIHQLFLEETALALLLINPQKEDPFAEAGDWLKSLKTAAGNREPGSDVPKLLIFSQIDVGGMKLGNSKIVRFADNYGFIGWLATSAQTGKNCSDSENGGKPSELKQLIASNIQWEKLPWTSTPRLLAALKNAVVAMRDERDIRLLRFAELTQRLEQALPGESFGETDVRTAVTLLANHGVVRPLKFGDLVLLQPELLNGYAAAIIRAARTHTDEIGCVLEADIYKPHFDFIGVERLKHRPDEELLLRALVQTLLDRSLCIAENTPDGRHLVFPSQYRREKDIPRDPDTFVAYNFSGEWQTIWTTLIVRLWYSQEFQHRELWRNAAEFEFSGRTLGLKIDNKQGDGTATISLYFDTEVKDEVKVIFIEYVHRHLAKYGSEVSRDRRYVCLSCGKPIRDLDAVRKRLAAKKEFITCQECDERVPLVDFIEQRLKSDPVARKILLMDNVATRELDTQALEQILIGHMMAIVGEANQIFRPVTMFDHGIDGEIEFKDNDGKASGKRIYIQLKSGNSYLRLRKSDGREVFDVKSDRHLNYWLSHPVDVYLVIRQTDDVSGRQTIRWMNITRHLRDREDKTSRQIIFVGDKLDMESVWRVRDEFFPR